MNDIMLFGAGHHGTKKQVAPGVEKVTFSSSIEPHESRNRLSFSSYSATFIVETVYQERGGYLIGVCGDAPSDGDIVKAIFKYNPKPIGQ